MKRKILLWLFIGGLALSLSMSAFAQNKKAVAMITEVSGTVKLKTGGEEQEKAAGMGTLLFPGDKVFTGEDGQATILVIGGKEKKLSKNASFVVAAKAAEKEANSRVSQGLDTLFAFKGEEEVLSITPALRAQKAKFAILAPRDTRLREPSPTIKWTEVKKNSTYLVKIISEDEGTILNKKMPGTALNLASVNIELQPGINYFIIVSAGDLGLEDRIYLYRLSEAEEKEIAAYEADLAKMTENAGLSPATASILRANAYYQHGLFLEAAEMYKAMMKANADQLYPRERLLQTYLQMNMLQEATALEEQIKQIKSN